MARYYGTPLHRAREAFTLSELAAMVVHLPRESATWRAIHGQDRVEWDLQAQIAAQAANSLAWLVWAQTKDGERNRNRPDPLLPPWVEDENKDVRRFGGAPLPLAELDDWLGWSA